MNRIAGVPRCTPAASYLARTHLVTVINAGSFRSDTSVYVVRTVHMAANKLARTPLVSIIRGPRENTGLSHDRRQVADCRHKKTPLAGASGVRGRSAREAYELFIDLAKVAFNLALCRDNEMDNAWVVSFASIRCHLVHDLMQRKLQVV